jgi:hypothetical protein
MNPQRKYERNEVLFSPSIMMTVYLLENNGQMNIAITPIIYEIVSKVLK